MASRPLAPGSRSRTPAFPALLDPFRFMNTLLSDVVSARPGDGAGNDMLLAQPRMNIDDTGNEIRVTAELPGVSENDVQITLDDDMLIIAGEKRDEREVDDRDVRPRRAHVRPVPPRHPAAVLAQPRPGRRQLQGRRSHDHGAEECRAAQQAEKDRGEARFRAGRRRLALGAELNRRLRHNEQ